MSDIVPPCDCVELVDGNYISRCYCSNRDDGERAAAWCVEANHKAAADYDRCTIKFLRKEAAEQAAEIERLRAALREMAQEDGTNARRMRAAIVAARAKLTISRPHWTGPILQADGILAQALTVNNDSAALDGTTRDEIDRINRTSMIRREERT